MSYDPSQNMQQRLRYSRSQKNVSNIVQFRLIKRYFPFGSFPVFGSFRPIYRSVPFCFVYARAFTMERRSSDGLAIARAGLCPLSRKASRGFSP